jgi:Tol biopolymer transport system component
MGEVYRARDTRLGRSVALKTIAPAGAADATWRDRFQREARLVSSLQHPHLCPLFDVGHDHGVDYLVMQLLEGETLAGRLARGPLPVNEALAIAIDIAEALDHAHRAGIAHRDVKPGNVMLIKSGAVLLDFGLAAHATPPDATTVSRSLTATGVIIGTVQYMAPEQVEGREADARTDVFALGTVLYEMLAGRPAFSGATHAALAAAILSATPPLLSTLRDEVPPLLARIVAKCLEKDPDRRWQDVRDFADALRLAREPDDLRALAPPPPSQRLRVAALAATGLALAAVVAIAFLLLALLAAPETGSGHVIRLSVPAPEGGLVEPEVSPDGRAVAFVAPGPEGSRMLWLRSFSEDTARALAGTAGATDPFWSRDGRALGFFSPTGLKRIDLAGGAPQMLDAVTGPYLGGSWGADGTIVFSRRYSLHRRTASGVVNQLTQVDLTLQENSHRWPHFLPDGRRFLYVARSGRPDRSGAYLASIDGAPPIRLFSTLSEVVYSPTGHLVFWRDGSVIAQPFDLNAAQITGAPVVIARNVDSRTVSLSAVFSISENGVLAYVPALERQSRLVWFDRTGRQIGALPALPFVTVNNFRLSPDERRIAIDGDEERRGSRSIWILERATGSLSRFTFPGSHDWQPVWSPDGGRIAFSSFRDGPSNIYAKPADNSGPDEPVLVGTDQISPLDWSRDGRFLVYETNPGALADVYALPMSGSRTPIPIATTDANEAYARFSPDGRWVSYISNESGRNEVYVKPFPPTGGKWQVSSAGAERARWGRDGHEILFVTRDNGFFVVDVQLAPTFRSGAPRLLFRLPSLNMNSDMSVFDVRRDGRLLVNVRAESADRNLRVTVNWPALLTPSQETSR